MYVLKKLKFIAIVESYMLMVCTYSQFYPYSVCVCDIFNKLASLLHTILQEVTHYQNKRRVYVFQKGL